MTPHEFCQSGKAETIKGGFHAAAATLFLFMAGYNVAAWCYRRERHLGLNSILYGAGFAWEVRQTVRHWCGDKKSDAVTEAWQHGTVTGGSLPLGTQTTPVCEGGVPPSRSFNPMEAECEST